jgi:RimJ/RimL family protein N-acetyltransferase
VILRRHTPADLDLLYEAAAESRGPGFSEWMVWCPEDYRREQAEDFLSRKLESWDKSEEYSLAVLDAQTGRYVGGTGFNKIIRQHGYANLGYWIRRSEWGKGYAVSACWGAARFGFERLRLIRAEIVIAVGNERSVRVAEKAGAQNEGVLRNRLKLGAEIYDAHMFSLIPSDPPPRRSG